MCSGISVHVEECVEVEDGQGELFQGGLSIQEFRAQGFFGGGRQAAPGEAPGVIDYPGGWAALLEETIREDRGQLVGSLAVQQLERLRRVRGLLTASAGEQGIGR